MTREEREKAIDALKISTPIMAMTQEEFNDYIQILNKIMDWLEQEPILDKIRAEIAEIQLIGYATVDGKREIASRAVLDILDKYKAESEVGNGNVD